MLGGLTLNVLNSTAATVYPFDRASLALTGFVKNFSTVPWVGTASAGISGESSQNFVTAGVDPDVGSALNGFGTADFNGTNDYLETTALVNAFYSSTALSGWALVNIDSISSNDSGNLFHNDSIIGYAVSSGMSIYLRSNAGGEVGVTMYDGSINQYTATAVFSTGAWQLVQWRYTGGGNLEIRVNSGAWSSTSTSAGAGYLYNTAGATLDVGKSSTNGGSSYEYLDGRIAELALSNTVFNNATFENVRTDINTVYGLSL
jgi:hypothetical protein